MSDKVMLTCALTGVLTNPKQHPVPVTPEEMAAEARRAFEAGAACMHVHFRQQTDGLGHLPSWDPEVASEICEAIRQACPGVLINMSTGILGDDIRGPLACLEKVRPEMAALNAGSLNYLRTRRDGSWAWPPILFDNPVEKIERFATRMRELEVVPECECFDTGIVRSTALFEQVGLLPRPAHLSLVMGVQSGMPAKASWLPLLKDEMPKGAHWQVIGIGREEVWPLHRQAAELGGHVRTGLEDTFYLPSGEKARSNGELVAELARVAREAGRDLATTETARALLCEPAAAG